METDSNLLKLFELLTEKPDRSLEPVFAPHTPEGISYPLVESYLKIDAQVAVQLLEDLSRLGYLERQFAERIFLCPRCNADRLKLVFFCPKCHSPEILRTRVLKHRTCGYSGPADDFLRYNRRVCPKCRDELLLLGSDYEDLGYRYRCPHCRELIRLPVERWHCSGCGQLYEKNGVRELVLYKYCVNPEQMKKIQEERIPRSRVKNLLTQEGYEVQEAVTVSGRSGARHLIDILAVKRSGPLEHQVVIGFAGGATEIPAEEVIKLYAKAYDIGAQDIILIAGTALSPEAQQFAQHYHIRVYPPDQIDQLIAAAEKTS
ncbi:MAG: restriction endonuclease [candidate division WOR-3 bacterium]|uniref:Thaumarchaeal output domain-containing protein n=2 Tax=candidate division WOR-3 bacterium TaxID=2052148 RepID=A0A7C1NDK1_UNCW3|nr:restriction endonuclease [candidate division WOR-3 bacterium]